MGNFSCVIDIKVKVKRAGICDGVTSTAVWLSSLLQGLSDTYVYMVTIKYSTGFHALRLPHWHSIHFDVFSSISTKLSMVIENAIDYSFSCNSLFIPWVGKCKMLHSRNSTQNSSLFLPYFKRTETLNVFEEHISILSIFDLELMCKFWSQSGHNNQHSKNIHLPVKTIFCNTCTGPSSM